MEVLLENGNTSIELKTVLSTWKHNYKNLLNPERHSSNEHDNPLTPENFVNQPDATTLLNMDISLKEVAVAVGKARPGKAVGIDKIPSETLKNPTVICALHDLFVRCFHEGVTPKDWSKSIICPIPKSAGFQSNHPLQYRGISIAPAICKIYTYVLNRRLTQWMEDNNKLSDCQNGFRRGRSTIDHLTTLSSIVECRKSQLKATYAAFIELVDRQKLRYKLRATGVKGKFYNSIISL